MSAIDYSTIPLVKNEADKRFEIDVEGYKAFIDYKETSSQIWLIHTEADPALAGKGAAKAVVEKTLAYVKESSKKLLPFCPYVFAYIKKHPEWKAIVDEKFKGYDQL